MALGDVIARLSVVLGLDTAAFEKGNTLAQKQLAQTQKKFEKLGSKIGGVGKTLSIGLTAPIAAAGLGVVKLSGDFEEAMTKVSISTGAATDDMTAMSDLALQLGKDTLFGATEAADAMDMLAKNGLSAKEILDGAATAAVTLATAAGSELAPAADAITDVMAQFKLGTDQLDFAVNQITGAVNESKLDFVDFAGAIAQAGGVAGSSGVSFEDFNATIAATSSLFASGSDAGTSFKTFITSLSGNSDAAKDAIAELGLSFFDAQGNMRSMAEIAEELRTKLAGLTEQDRTAALKTIFGTDAMRTAIGLMDQGAAGIDNFKQKISEVDASGQAAERMENFNGQLDNLKGAIETLAIRIGQSGMLEALTGLVTGAADFIDKLSELNPEILKWATMIAGVVAVVGPLLVGVGAIVSAVGTMLPIIIGVFKIFGAVAGIIMTGVIPAIGGLIIALAPILIPLAVAAAAVGAVYLAWKNWDKIEPIIRNVYNGVKTWILDKLGAVWNAVKGAVSAYFNLYTNLTGAAINAVSALYRGVKTWLIDRLNAVWDGLKAKIENVKQTFANLYDAVVGNSYVPDMVDGIAAEMARLDAVMVAPAIKATSTVKDAFRAMASDARSMLDRLFPDAAKLQRFRDDMAKVAGFEAKGPAAGGVSSDLAREMRSALRIDFLSDGIRQFAEAANDNADKVETANVRIVKSFKDMADETLGAMQRLSQAIKGGGFLDILEGVLGLGLQLGSIGAFGKKVQTNINATPRALGGPITAGRPYLVGERGPELVVPNHNGRVIPNNKLGAGGGFKIDVTPSPYFDVRVTEISSGVAGQTVAGNNARNIRRGQRRLAA